MADNEGDDKDANDSQRMVAVVVVALLRRLYKTDIMFGLLMQACLFLFLFFSLEYA